jgi:hypothetical protein
MNHDRVTFVYEIIVFSRYEHGWYEAFVGMANG